MHFRHFAWALPAVVCLTGTAFAQDKPKGNNTPSGKITVEKNTGSLEATARSRAAAGDCKGALDYYDAALTTSIEPELHRDRGICHEKLGHPYPAIDDYRFYLTNRPNATDAETIRERMDSLVEQTGQAPSDKSAAAAKSEEKKEEGDAKVTTSVGVGSGGVLVSLNPKANADDDPGANPEGGKSIDAIDKDEKLESEAEISPLRNGQGPMLGAFFTEHYWTKSNVGIGSLPATAAESVGGLFRYAFIPGHSFISEIGYVARNARQGSPAWGGYDLYAGYEAKVRFDGRSTNALILQVGLGYQRHTQKESGAIESMFVPRGRIGIRHVFGKGFGLEFAGDVGHASIWLVDTGLRTDSWILGGEVAALVGF